MRSTSGVPEAASEPETTERKQIRKSWAALIRRVYEVDPLLCACGATTKFEDLSLILLLCIDPRSLSRARCQTRFLK
jgi:hypothetical protein